MQDQNQILVYIHFFQFTASSLLNIILGPELQYSAFHLPKQPTRLTFFGFGNLWPVRSRMIKKLFYNLCMRLIITHKSLKSLKFFILLPLHVNSFIRYYLPSY